MTDWILLETYASQTEARVVESFLRAKGIEVQLLDTHTYSLLPSRTVGAGMRLLVRAEDVERSRKFLAEAAAFAHLSIVVDETVAPPSAFGRKDRILIAAFLFLGLMGWLALKLRS